MGKVNRVAGEEAADAAAARAAERERREAPARARALAEGKASAAEAAAFHKDRIECADEAKAGGQQPTTGRYDRDPTTGEYVDLDKYESCVNSRRDRRAAALGKVPAARFQADVVPSITSGGQKSLEAKLNEALADLGGSMSPAEKGSFVDHLWRRGYELKRPLTDVEVTLAVGNALGLRRNEAQKRGGNETPLSDSEIGLVIRTVIER